MQNHLPHVAFLLNASKLILDPSVYHYAIRELNEIEAAIGEIRSTISMGQAAIAYHKNLVDSYAVADSNIKHTDLYQAEAESIKARSSYKAHLMHLKDLLRAKKVMTLVRDQCEVLGIFENEGVCQLYEMAELRKYKGEKVDFKLPFYPPTKDPRLNHVTDGKIEDLLVLVAEIEEGELETPALPSRT